MAIMIVEAALEIVFACAQHRRAVLWILLAFAAIGAIAITANLLQPG